MTTVVFSNSHLLRYSKDCLVSTNNAIVQTLKRDIKPVARLGSVWFLNGTIRFVNGTVRFVNGTVRFVGILVMLLYTIKNVVTKSIQGITDEGVQVSSKE